MWPNMKWPFKDKAYQELVAALIEQNKVKNNSELVW